MQQNTIQALKDGTFLDNVKKDFLRLKCSPDQIKSISLWGQEPTLTLEYVTAGLKDWLGYFYRANTFLFVTNGQSGANKIIDFIKELDRQLQHAGDISIQFSYDGAEQTRLSRMASPEKIFETIKTVIEGLNGYHFEHLTDVYLHLHGVLSMDLVKRLDTVEKMYDYYNEFEDFATRLANMNVNSVVKIGPWFSVALETPVDATAEDGFRYANFYRQSMMMTNLQGMQNTFITGVSNNFRHTFKTLRDFPFETISDFLGTWKFNDNNFVNTIFNLSMHMFCGTNNNEYKFLYDGTICNCQNCIYDTELENYGDLDNDEVTIKKMLVKHKFFVNPLTATDEELENMLDMFSLMHKESFMFEYCQAISLMYLLALSHQIDESYLVDHNKLMRHAFELSISFGCWYNNAVKTGSVFCKNAGLFRLCCNGLLDEIEKHECYILDKVEEFREGKNNDVYMINAGGPTDED